MAEMNPTNMVCPMPNDTRLNALLNLLEELEEGDEFREQIEAEITAVFPSVYA